MGNQIWPKLPGVEMEVGATYETRHGKEVTIVRLCPFMPDGFVFATEGAECGIRMFYNEKGEFYISPGRNPFDLVKIIKLPPYHGRLNIEVGKRYLNRAGHEVVCTKCDEGEYTVKYLHHNSCYVVNTFGHLVGSGPDIYELSREITCQE